MRFEVLERGPVLWRILDRQTMRVDYVVTIGDRFAIAQVAVEVEDRHPQAREYVVHRLARHAGWTPPEPPQEPVKVPPPPPTPEVDAGYLWRRFIYGTD